MEHICGIYKITNKLNGKCYIGQSVDIYNRWHEHKYADCKDSVIHRAIKKYGKDNFSFEILEKIPREELNEREIYWIKYYDSYNNGYNLTLGGDTGIKYDYGKIVELWDSGLTAKEIEKQLNCDDKVVTNALRYFNISEETVRSKSNCNPSKPIVAIDISSGIPLKIFKGSWDACNFFKSKNKSYFLKAIKNHYRYLGYYWEHLRDDNIPEKELTNEEFLSYQQKLFFTKSKEMREQISITNRIVERCSREELKQLIRTTPFTTIAKQFNVSDNAIRKWCDWYDLPRRVKDIKSYSDEEWANI